MPTYSDERKAVQRVRMARQEHMKSYDRQHMGQLGDDATAVSAPSKPTTAGGGSGYKDVAKLLGPTNYTAMVELFSGSGAPPPGSDQDVMISFELFEAGQKRFADTKAELTKLQQEHTKKQDRLTEYQRENEKQKTRIQGLTHQLKEAQEYVTTLRKYSSEAVSMRERHESETTELKKDLKETKDRMENLHCDLQTSNTKMSDALVALAQRDAVVANLRRQKNELDRKVKSLTESKDKGAGGGSAVSSGLESSPSALAKLRNVVKNSSQQHVAQMKIHLNNLEEEKKLLEIEIREVMALQTATRRTHESRLAKLESATMGMHDLLGKAQVFVETHASSSFLPSGHGGDQSIGGSQNEEKERKADETVTPRKLLTGLDEILTLLQSDEWIREHLEALSPAVAAGLLGGTQRGGSQRRVSMGSNSSSSVIGGGGGNPTVIGSSFPGAFRRRSLLTQGLASSSSGALLASVSPPLLEGSERSEEEASTLPPGGETGGVNSPTPPTTPSQNRRQQSPQPSSFRESYFSVELNNCHSAFVTMNRSTHVISGLFAKVEEIIEHSVSMKELQEQWRKIDPQFIANVLRFASIGLTQAHDFFNDMKLREAQHVEDITYDLERKWQRTLQVEYTKKAESAQDAEVQAMPDTLDGASMVGAGFFADLTNTASSTSIMRGKLKDKEQGTNTEAWYVGDTPDWIRSLTIPPEELEARPRALFDDLPKRMLNFHKRLMELSLALKKILKLKFSFADPSSFLNSLNVKPNISDSWKIVEFDEDAVRALLASLIISKEEASARIQHHRRKADKYRMERLKDETEGGKGVSFEQRQEITQYNRMKSTLEKEITEANGVISDQSLQAALMRMMQGAEEFDDYYDEGMNNGDDTDSLQGQPESPQEKAITDAIHRSPSAATSLSVKNNKPSGKGGKKKPSLKKAATAVRTAARMSQGDISSSSKTTSNSRQKTTSSHRNHQRQDSLEAEAPLPRSPGANASAPAVKRPKKFDRGHEVDKLVESSKDVYVAPLDLKFSEKIKKVGSPAATTLEQPSSATLKSGATRWGAGVASSTTPRQGSISNASLASSSGPPPELNLERGGGRPEHASDGDPIQSGEGRKASVMSSSSAVGAGNNPVTKQATGTYSQQEDLVGMMMPCMPSPRDASTNPRLNPSILTSPAAGAPLLTSPRSKPQGSSFDAANDAEDIQLEGSSLGVVAYRTPRASSISGSTTSPGGLRSSSLLTLDIGGDGSDAMTPSSKGLHHLLSPRNPGVGFSGGGDRSPQQASSIPTTPRVGRARGNTMPTNTPPTMYLSSSNQQQPQQGHTITVLAAAPPVGGGRSPGTIPLSSSPQEDRSGAGGGGGGGVAAASFSMDDSLIQAPQNLATQDTVVAQYFPKQQEEEKEEESAGEGGGAANTRSGRSSHPALLGDDDNSAMGNYELSMEAAAGSSPTRTSDMLLVPLLQKEGPPPQSTNDQQKKDVEEERRKRSEEEEVGKLQKGKDVRDQQMVISSKLASSPATATATPAVEQQQSKTPLTKGAVDAILPFPSAALSATQQQQQHRSPSAGVLEAAGGESGYVPRGGGGGPITTTATPAAASTGGNSRSPLPSALGLELVGTGGGGPSTAAAASKPQPPTKDRKVVQGHSSSNKTAAVGASPQLRTLAPAASQEDDKGLFPSVVVQPVRWPPQQQLRGTAARTATGAEASVSGEEKKGKKEEGAADEGRPPQEEKEQQQSRGRIVSTTHLAGPAQSPSYSRGTGNQRRVKKEDLHLPVLPGMRSFGDKLEDMAVTSAKHWATGGGSSSSNPPSRHATPQKASSSSSGQRRESDGQKQQQEVAGRDISSSQQQQQPLLQGGSSGSPLAVVGGSGYSPAQQQQQRRVSRHQKQRFNPQNDRDANRRKAQLPSSERVRGYQMFEGQHPTAPPTSAPSSGDVIAISSGSSLQRQDGAQVPAYLMYKHHPGSGGGPQQQPMWAATGPKPPQTALPTSSRFAPFTFLKDSGGASSTNVTATAACASRETYRKLLPHEALKEKKLTEKSMKNFSPRTLRMPGVTDDFTSGEYYQTAQKQHRMSGHGLKGGDVLSMTLSSSGGGGGSRHSSPERRPRRPSSQRLSITSSGSALPQYYSTTSPPMSPSLSPRSTGGGAAGGRRRHSSIAPSSVTNTPNNGNAQLVVAAAVAGSRGSQGSGASGGGGTIHPLGGRRHA